MTEPRVAPTAPPPAVRLGLQPTQWILALFLLALLGGLVVNSFHAAEQRAADAVFRLTTETSNANIVFTQRESTNFGLAVERWLGRGIPRRQVQIARALLEQRLSVKDDKGITSAELTSQEYLDALYALDRGVAAQQPGLLDEASQPRARDEIEPLLDTFLSESRTLLTTYQQQSDNRYRALALARSESDQVAAVLLAAFFIGTIVFLLWVFTTSRRSFRQALQRINDDAAELEDARGAIELANELERGQAKVLERIARGAPLDVVYRLIVDLAHPAVRGHLLIKDHDGALIACCGAKPGRATWMTGFAGTDSDNGGQVRTITVFSDDGTVPTAEQIQVTRRFADVARIAVERHANESRLRQQASFDPLTGLANRTLLVTRLESALHRRSRAGHVAVLFCDLDRFKQVNDTMGHDAGDLLLSEAGSRLQGIVRQTDTVARLGGDEFVVLCEGLAGPWAAEDLAGRVQATLSEPFRIGGIEVYVDVSIGIAHASPEGTASASDMIRDADVAMYWAKRRDGKRWASFDATLQAAAHERLKMDSALRHAIERHEFRVYFQPIVDLGTRSTRGFEALLRWQHPELGLLEPADFLPVAESVGLMGEVGDWVLRESLTSLAQWRAEGRFTDAYVSVNVSGRQLRDAQFPVHVGTVLASVGVDASRLVLEVTEDMLVTDPVSQETLSRLRSMGVRIALDDFGTGYSSLTQLHGLQVDILKLDRSFVAPLSTGNARDVAVLQSVVGLAEAMELELVIEGVETELERSKLLELGAVLGQGFVFGRPVPSVSIPTQGREGVSAATGG